MEALLWVEILDPFDGNIKYNIPLIQGKSFNKTILSQIQKWKGATTIYVGSSDSKRGTTILKIVEDIV